MGKGEVDLVIRAKAEFERAVKDAKSFYNDLVAGSKAASGAIDNTKTAVNALEKEIEDLKRGMAGLQALNNIGVISNRAATSVERMREAVRSNTRELGELSRKSADVNRVATAVKELGEPAAAVMKARKALADYNKTLEKTQKVRATRGVGVESALMGRPAAVSAGNFLKAELDRAQAAFDKASASVKKYGVDVDNLKQVSKSSSKEQVKLAESIQTTRAKLDSSISGLKRAVSEQTQISKTARDASAALGGLEANQSAVARESAKMAQQIARAQAEIARLNAAAKQTVPMRGSLSADAGNVDQRRAGLERLRELRRELPVAEAEAQRLNQALAQSKNPTDAMGVAAGTAAAKVRQLRDELLQMQAALRGAQQGGFGRIDALAQPAAPARRLDPATGLYTQQVQGNRSVAASYQSLDRAISQNSESHRSNQRVVESSLNTYQKLRRTLFFVFSAYHTLQGTVAGLASVVKSFQTLEATQNRLGAIFDQDTGRVADELAFLDRQAARLGISFGVLGDQYGKFAVAAKSANFEAQATRDIFLSVAEAGRVNKLSQEQLNGVFLALEQMISKGRVSSEELRRQMGDRLPGAFNIFASALGVSTAELDKMLRAGEVAANQETLIKFANELNKRFGPQLAKALKSTTTEIGKFQNNLYQAQLQFADGGFIKGFTNLLISLNEAFRSREGRDFFLALGAAAGRVADALSLIPPYFSQITYAAQALLAVGIARAFIAIAGYVGNFGTSLTNTLPGITSVSRNLVVARRSIRDFNTGITSVTGALGGGISAFQNFFVTTAMMGPRAAAFAAGTTIMTRSIGFLRTALAGAIASVRLLWAAIGGLPGLILTGVTMAVMGWATSVDDTTEALDEHKRIMGEVLTAYDEAKKKATSWQEEIAKGNKVTVAQAEKNFLDIQKIYKDLRTKLFVQIEANYLNIAQAAQGLGDGAAFDKFDKLYTSLKKGEINAQTFAKQLNELYNEFESPELRKVINDFLQLSEQLGLAEIDMGRIADVANGVGVKIEGLGEIAIQTGQNVKTASNASKDGLEKVQSPLEAINEQLKIMQGEIPQMGEEMKRLEEIKVLEDWYKQTVALINAMSELPEHIRKAKLAQLQTVFDAKAVDIFGGTFNGDGIALIKKFEKYVGQAYEDGKPDKNGNFQSTYRAGYGSDTYTTKDGKYHTVEKGMFVSLEDANRDLLRRYAEFQNVVIGQIGSEKFNQFSKQQQGVLTSIAYNYGSLPRQLREIVKTGSVDDIANEISRMRADKGNGVPYRNAKRRDEESAIFRAGGSSIQLNAELAQSEEERLAKQKEFLENRAAELEQRRIMLEQEGKLTQEQFVQQGIQERIKQAKEAGVELTGPQLEQERELLRKEWERDNALGSQKQKLQEAKQLLQEMNALQSQQQTLVSQIKAAEKSGDTDTVSTLKSQLEESVAKFNELEVRARAAWDAVGGEEAKAKLTTMDTLKLKSDAAANSISTIGQRSMITGEQINTMLADGLTNAFSQFAQAIANGEKASKALKKAFLQFAADFLRKIGEMIIRQALMNALQGGGGPNGGVGGMLSGFIGKLFHSGGVVGQAGPGRTVNPAMFANAIRYHSGGIAGLRPGEVPAILKRGEEVLTGDDPRHVANGGGMGSESRYRIINVLDSASALEQALRSRRGESAILNFMSDNKSAVSSAGA